MEKEQETKARQEAILNVDAFSKVFEHYRDNKLPPINDYFKNFVETNFGVPRQLVEEFIQMLIASGKFSGILRESQGLLYVVFAETIPEEQKDEEEEQGQEESPQVIYLNLNLLLLFQKLTRLNLIKYLLYTVRTKYLLNSLRKY